MVQYIIFNEGPSRWFNICLLNGANFLKLRFNGNTDAYDKVKFKPPRYLKIFLSQTKQGA